MVLSSNIPQAQRGHIEPCASVSLRTLGRHWGFMGALDIYLTDNTYSTYACVKAGYLHGVQAGASKNIPCLPDLSSCVEPRYFYLLSG